MTKIGWEYWDEKFPDCTPLTFTVITTSAPQRVEDIVRIRWVWGDGETREDVCRLLWTGDWHDSFELTRVDADTPTTIEDTITIEL